MKRAGIILIGLTAVGALTVLAFGGFRQASACQGISTDAPTDVDMLMKSPACFRGTIQVRGVVSSVLPEKNALVLIDRHEADDCEDGNCPLRKLPVSWSGKMPKVKSEIRAAGQIEKSGGKLVFAAKVINELSKKEAQ